MIELKMDELIFTFPEIYSEARLTISFQRTLRIPDDGKDYPLPPGLGSFPLKHVDDYMQSLPEKWKERGGVMLPMYQSEAMWIDFSSSHLYKYVAEYPFAVKIAAGKINAITGEPWSNGLSRNPQDYLVIPSQPWLDGYCVEKGLIRQFVAMPLGEGYSAEEQINQIAEIGGLQIEVYPMKRKAFEKRWPITRHPKAHYVCKREVMYSISPPPDMALAPGGRMRQEVYEDEFEMSEWDLNTSSRCFVHLTDSRVWKTITGKNPPTIPITAKQYSEHRLPWFEYYGGSRPLAGSKVLGKLQSVVDMAIRKGVSTLQKNESLNQKNIFRIKKNRNSVQVREWKGRG